MKGINICPLFGLTIPKFELTLESPSAISGTEY